MGPARTLALLCAIAGSGCTRGPNVERVYSGAAVEGRYIEPAEYAAVLRRTLAEAERAAGDAGVEVRSRDTNARAAEDLAGMGALGAAWAQAGAAIDESDEPLSEERGLSARLAVDQAIACCDRVLVQERTTRARVSLEQTAARALLAGKRELARSIALTETQADPGAWGARLVFTASGGADVMDLLEPRADARPISAAEWVAYAEALQHVTSPAAARSVVRGLAHRPILAGDDRVVRAAVHLAARGVIDVEALPATGRVELAVIRDATSSNGGEEPSFDMSALDARHRYLALARAAPSDAGTRELGDRLRKIAASDPIVAAARALAELAGGAKVESTRARALVDLNPADPVLASVALRVAASTGEHQVAELARAVLAVAGPLRD